MGFERACLAVLAVRRHIDVPCSRSGTVPEPVYLVRRDRGGDDRRRSPCRPHGFPACAGWRSGDGTPLTLPLPRGRLASIWRPVTLPLDRAPVGAESAPDRTGRAPVFLAARPRTWAGFPAVGGCTVRDMKRAQARRGEKCAIRGRNSAWGSRWIGFAAAPVAALTAAPRAACAALAMRVSTSAFLRRTGVIRRMTSHRMSLPPYDGIIFFTIQSLAPAEHSVMCAS